MNVKHSRQILIQANEAETTTASGLVIDTARRKPQGAPSSQIGPGRWDEDGEKRIPLDVARATPSSTANAAAPRSSTTARVPDPVGPRRAGCRLKVITHV